jgi:hypothetical protein
MKENPLGSILGALIGASLLGGAITSLEYGLADSIKSPTGRDLAVGTLVVLSIIGAVDFVYSVWRLLRQCFSF